MKVLLVAPRINKPDTVERSKPLFPPLSIMTVASLTPPDFDVELIDEDIRPVPFDTSADLIGITTTTSTANRAYWIADRFREIGKTVVIGGIHATALPQEAALHADAVVVGEAEGKWQKLLHGFQTGTLQEVYFDAERPRPEEIPQIRRDLIGKNDYLFANTIQTTRGCPYACSFCSVSSFFGRTYRTRPVRAVIEEVRKLPGKLVLFVDDNIMGYPRYAKELFSELIPVGKRWIGQASLSMLKYPELVKLAAKSGCSGLFVGMETLSNTTLAKIGKLVNRRENYERAVSLLHDQGISILGSFIFGFDEDDDQVFERTVDFVNHTRMDAALFSILTPFPGTELFESLSRQGRITDSDWSHYDGQHVVYRPVGLGVDALLDGLKKAYRQVYSYGAILRRIGPALRNKSLTWAVNAAYRQRVTRWAGGIG